MDEIDPGPTLSTFDVLKSIYPSHTIRAINWGASRRGARRPCKRHSLNDATKRYMQLVSERGRVRYRKIYRAKMLLWKREETKQPSAFVAHGPTWEIVRKMGRSHRRDSWGTRASRRERMRRHWL